jgi:hypothetical protein
MNVALGQRRMDHGHRRLPAGPETEIGGADEHRHVAVRVFVVVHQLMGNVAVLRR